MRILHTADWHLGKTIEGRDRIPEQEEFIEEICQICADEKVDLVLIAGDLFQTVNPSAAAEGLFFDALERLADHGRRAVAVIAGNHDNPDRIAAASALASHHGITLIGLPNSPLSSTSTTRPIAKRILSGPSWFELEVPGCDHHAVITALPYPSESRLYEIIAESFDDSILQQAYHERVRQLFSSLSDHYRKDTINLAMSHLYVTGGIESESEVQIQVGGAYAVSPAAFPQDAQYIALGHLHRPQFVHHDGPPIRYSGSPLSYSFSEAGQKKSVTILNIEPGQPANIREITLSAGRPLVRIKAEQGLQQAIMRLEEPSIRNAWIDLELYLDEPLTIAIAQELRTWHSGIVNIRPILPQSDDDAALERRSDLSIEQMFIRFFESRHHVAPDDELVQLFLQLANEAQEGTDDVIPDTRREETV